MKRFTSLSLFLVIAGCGGGGYVVDGTQELYLLTNLRPNARGVMTSVLQWRGATVLPVCTPVQIGGVSSREIRFRDRSTGQVYRYLLHRSTRTPIQEHVNRYFGAQCPNVAAYSPIDQQGIASGQILPGMSKEGVIIAAGYPPEHQTPSLEAPTWTYWGDRSRVQVQFNGDIVAAINDPNAPQQVQPIQPQPQPEPEPAGPPVIGPDGYPVQSQAPVQGSATVTVQAGGYPQAPPASATVQVQAAPTTATVTVQGDAPRQRARRQRRRRRAAVGVTVGGAVVAGAAAGAATSNRRQRTVTRRRTTVRTSGCSTLTINGSVYSDHPNTPMGQSCDGGGCPASYVCVMPLGVCVPEEGQRCR